MPRSKRAKTKGPKVPEGQPSNGALAENEQAEIAVAQAAPPEELQPPTSPVETADLPLAQEMPAAPSKRRDRPAPQKPAGASQGEQRQPGSGSGKAGDDKDHIAATSLNIAKLQSMSMTELNQ